MAEPEHNRAIARNSETNVLSKKEKKLVVFAIALLCFLILVLVGLIAEAYINQHPVFEFLEYDAFRSGMTINGSVSLAILYIGILIFIVAACLLIIFDLIWRIILLIHIIIGFIFILISLCLSFISYDWQIKYSIYRYLGFILLLIGAIGKMSDLTVAYVNSRKNEFRHFASTSKFPFSLLLFVGFLLTFSVNIF